MRFQVICMYDARNCNNIINSKNVSKILLENPAFIAEGNKRLMIMNLMARDQSASPGKNTYSPMRAMRAIELAFF